MQELPEEILSPALNKINVGSANAAADWGTVVRLKFAMPTIWDV